MSFPGEVLKFTVASKIFIAKSTVLEFNIEIEYSFWDDNSYTVFSTRAIVPGYPEMVLPYPFKEKMLKDLNFVEVMKAHIRSIRRYPLD
ncbi:hypothetical protein PP939_gp048 [Rhizobium phage RL38J1]|uniref:Uncharacterized protein n=2 Tax=Innesvirus TaxID=3044739 RepID=A0A6B9J686_9CAUD|nr:hypothetical protein PP939_gp048 [Rhizobium phage RL38J1]YP_010662935.1 hypothetical protein PP940_gp257 [Rhizobium phage RL2RES]QGZ14012.1 hypothetical protein RL38J1_048 [Rhizobium phage RL38J1]QGZ14285.1 hypothetical protein RL2RES_257 [Rhizobium phage RL2RES]